VTAMRVSRMADTGLTQPAYGIKSFLGTFF
jgi:hypothetical protein